MVVRGLTSSLMVKSEGMLESISDLGGNHVTICLIYHNRCEASGKKRTSAMLKPKDRALV